MKIENILNKQFDEKDKYNLKRFHNAQKFVYDEVLMEVFSGKKQTNWMVFMFPQIVGLGTSELSKEFAIFSKEEARAYVKNDYLWGNYLEILTLLLKEHRGKIPQVMFGKNDAKKLKSSLTLFSFIAPKEKIIKDVLTCFYANDLDKKTIEILKTLKK